MYESEKRSHQLLIKIKYVVYRKDLTFECMTDIYYLYIHIYSIGKYR